MATKIASVGGMYGADSGSSYKTPSLGRAAPSADMGTAVATTMNPAPGSGPATAPVKVISLLPAGLASQSFLGLGAPWWVAMIVLFLGVKWAAEQVGKESEFGSIRIGLYNMFVIWGVYVITANAGKFIAAKYRVGGLSDLILAA